ncbi:MAG: trigger factor [Planctomycetota bacterium]
MDEEKAEQDPQEQVDAAPQESVEQAEGPPEDAEATAPAPSAEEAAPAAAEEGEATTPEAEAEAEEEEHPGFTSTVEETGPCGRLLRVEASEERVAEEIDKAYDELRRTVFIKGFRPGHVPRHVLERRFGEEVLAGVKETLMDEGYQAALEEHELQPAVPPEIVGMGEEDEAAAPVLEPGEALRFEVTVEVAPEFTIDNYEGLVVERPSVTVSEGDVDQALEAFRMRRGDFAVVEDAAIEEGDVPVVHAVALVDGEEAWRGDELGAHIGDETVGGLSVPGLRDAFLGATPGESRTLKVTLPEEFPEEELGGREVDLEVTVDEVRRFSAPEPTDAWAQELDFEDLEDMREELADELRRQREREADEAVQRGLDQQLLELTSFDVPDGLVERMVENQKERQRLGLLYRGVPEEQIDRLIAEHEQRTREESARTCKLHFIYRLIAEQEKLFVTEGEVDQRVQAIALNYQRRPDEVRAELEESGRLRSLRQQMLEEKVRDFLVQHAEIRQAEAPPATGPEETEEVAAQLAEQRPPPEGEATEPDDEPQA